jgi:hypothetical protein
MCQDGATGGIKCEPDSNRGDRRLKRLLTYAGALVAASASLSEASFVDLQWQDIGIIAALGPRLTLRDWMMIVALLAFVALNVFLWSLPISQTVLFLITFPLGVAGLLAFMWFVQRE